MELKKASKIYQRINKIANNVKDDIRKKQLKDFAEKFRVEFIQSKVENKNV